MEKNNYIFISNSCLGEIIHNELCKCEYNNPFVATLIPEDYHFLKLCENLIYYMNCEPICDYKPSHKTFYSIQTKGVWYNNPEVAKYYPIIHLDDIEIHCIHENSIDETLKKFKRRIERFKNIINEKKYKIFYVMTWANLFTIHKNNDYKPYILKFLSNNIDEQQKYIFLGPEKYVEHNYYINDKIFDLNIQRRIDNVNIQINFIREKIEIINFINKNEKVPI